MKKRFEPSEDWDALREKIIGLGERSVRKSYYPELLHRYTELKRFRQLLDQSSELILVFDVTSLRVVDANDTACEILGRDRKNLLETDLSELHSVFVETVLEAIAEPGHSISVRTEVARPDSTMRTLDGWAKVVATDDQPTGMLVARDISDRLRAEEALQQSEIKYRHLYESMRDAFASFSMVGYLQEFNHAFQAMVGYSAEELRQLNYRDLTPEKWHALEANIFEKQVLKRGYSDVYEKEYRRKDGTVFPIELRAFLLRDTANQPTGMWAIVRDITERKRAEKELRLAQLSILWSADAVFWITSSGRFINVNDQACHSLGYTRAELLTMAVWDIDPGFPAEKWPRRWERTRQLKKRRFETRHRRKDGTIFPVEVTANNIEYEGQEYDFTFVRDITDRKRAKEELERHREHLEELVAERTAELRQAMTQLIQTEKLAALGSLVAGIAHELNTPLGNARIVAGSLGEHLREFAAAVDSGALRRSQWDTFLGRSQEAVDLLERNAARAADLIGHFKQVAVDQTSARRRRFDLRQTVEELLLTLQPQIKHTAHRVELDIAPGLELDSYPGPLEQVLANLIDNSFVHGFVGVATGCIRLQAQAIDSTRITLRYADSGTGIPAITLNRIFEPFFTTRLGQGGSGLGLYIVYNLVTAVLGGTIQAQSQPGQGTTFTLVLPRAAPDH